MMYRRYFWTAAVLVGLVSVTVLAVGRRSTSSGASREIPVVRVKRGRLDFNVHTSGELRPSRTTMLTAPPIGGGALQIIRLARTGSVVRKGDVIIQFDPSEQEYKLEQSQSEQKQAELEILQARTRVALQAAQDKVDLLKARFDVRGAELDVEQNELRSKIDAQKNQLKLEQARRALAQLEQDVQSHTASGRAALAVTEERSNKARLTMTQALRNIEAMSVRAPMDGIVAIEVSREGDEMPGGAVADYREGDQTQPGSVIAQVLDPTLVEIHAKVDERDRMKIKPGQSADVRLDALPGKTFRGTVKTVGGMVPGNFWEPQVSNKFETVIEFSGNDLQLRAGLTAQVLLLGEVRENVVSVPLQAVFIKNGKRVIFVRNGAFEAREVHVQAETESRAMIEGIAPDAEVALVDPTALQQPVGTVGGEPVIGAAP